MPGVFTKNWRPLPPPWDRASTSRALADLAEGAPEAAARIAADPDAANLTESIFGGSPFLRELILREHVFFETCLKDDPGRISQNLRAEIARCVRVAASDEEFLRSVRQVRSRGALLLAVADLTSALPTDAVLFELTNLADAIVRAAVDYLLLAASRAGQLNLPSARSPGPGSGYAVLAMGKLGAHELNYSSDIDLVVFFDPDAPLPARGAEPAEFFVRLTRRLVSLLQEVTADGYAYRVDLRLRPDPRATQVAISIEAAGIYYESMGQNWERAAMIKARPIAGDLALGQQFLERLEPYVWRKYLDFAAIADVQSLKRQIHAVKGHGEVAVRGHNVKLGRGGIREIEFFVQTQQLIAGGRNAALRGRSTVEVLGALAEAGWISSRVAEDLASDYRFLRRIENRLQMVADEQTHTLPRDDDDFERLSRFAGWGSAAELEQRLRSTFERVQGHYSALFEDAPALGGEKGSLVFTGGEDDPETLQTLRQMGFAQPSVVSATIRGWHFGRFPAMRSAKARQMLTEIMPALLGAIARSGDADRAFVAFDRFLSGLSAGVQIFSTLKANPRLLELVTRILGMAPRLADDLSHRPKVLDAVLDTAFFDALPLRAEMMSLTRPIVDPTLAFEDALDRARIIGKEQMFRIGVRILTETVNAEEAGTSFSRLADCLISRLLDVTRREVARRHGSLEGEKFAILALGKLGGREMTAASDLDLVLIYDASAGAEASGGKKSLSIMEYFARTGQRLIAALSSPTAEGSLYNVDLRLRPSGNKGPVATRLSSFTSYHQSSAWTWEKLALTRARVVAADAGFGELVEQAVRSALCSGAVQTALRAEVLDMRRQMVAHIHSAGLWDVKHARGGLVDIEFIAQYLQIANAPQHPDVLHQNTLAALTALEGGNLLTRADSQLLRRACALYHRLTQVLRLCVTGEFIPGEAPAGLRQLVVSACGVPDLASAETLLRETQEDVAMIFDRIIGPL